MRRDLSIANPGLKGPAPSQPLPGLLEQAWNLSRAAHGWLLTVHVPGMFVVDGRRGKYRAVSITGEGCALDCEHCKGSLLKTMAHALDAEALIRLGREAVARGDHGMLVTGGCDELGRLPWNDFIFAIETLKAETDLAISVHSGQIDLPTARGLKAAGVDQVLVDVIGDDRTAREVYHLPHGAATVRQTLDALAEVDLEIVPHIVFGIHYGKPRGERAALEMLKSYPIKQYVVVVLMPAKGTPMAEVVAPEPEEVASFLAWARLELPQVHAGLGCARPRGKYRRELDVLAVRAGINSVALPSDQCLEEARKRGLEISFRETCCSVA
ncbi:MAG: radical SAM protein [Thermodesulfobacteriota bacterium]